MDVRLGAAVSEVNGTHVRLGEESIPFGLCVWATGNAPTRVVSETIDQLGCVQKDAQKMLRGRIDVDPWLRARRAALWTCTRRAVTERDRSLRDHPHQLVCSVWSRV